MKRIKRMLAVMLSVVMLCSVVTIANTTETKAAVKIMFGKKITVTTGSTDVIVVKGKASAKSSNKKIAAIKKVKKGKKQTTITVKGMKTGKAKITVKVKKSKKKVKVVVNPKKVASVYASLKDNTSANVSWTAAKGAVKYELYRSENASSGFAKIYTGKAKSYVNTGLALGKYYYYKVKAIGNSSTKSAFSPVANVKTWKLAWSDEFNGSKLDESIWTYEIGDGSPTNPGWGNNELQWYEKNYVALENGKCVIKPQFQWNKATKTCVKKSYYSTRVITKNKKSFQYGKIEYSAKMPKGKGTWAAGWMLGQNNGWPTCGEIDIFETTSQLAKTAIPQSIHCEKFNGMPSSPGNKYKTTTVPTATSEYHTYAIEWTPTEIRFYIDGKHTWTYNPADYSFDGVKDNKVWPYKQPFYFIMNCAIGGTLGGTVDPTYWTKIATNGNIETYQDYLSFEYLRVYQ